MLINTLPKFSKIIRSNAKISILRGIRLIATDGRLDLYGTCLGISLQMSLPAGLLNMHEASIIVDYRVLHQAVKAIKDQRMRIEIYPDRLLVSDCSCKDQTTVHCIGEIEDFPKPDGRENLIDALARLEEDIPAHQKQNAKQFEKIKQERREQIRRSRRDNH